MAFELSPGALVRIGSAALFLVLSIVTFAMAKRTAANVAFALWALGFSASFALSNLLSDDVGTANTIFVLRAVFLFCSGIALAAAILLGFPGIVRPARGVVLVSFGLGTLHFVTTPSLNVTATTLIEIYPTMPTWIILGNSVGQALFYAVAVAMVCSLALRARASNDAALTKRLAITACAFGMHPAFVAGANLFGRGDVTLDLLKLGIMLVATSGMWLLANRRVGRPAWIAAWVFLGSGLFGAIDAAWLGGPFIGSASPWVGVVRTLAAGAFAWAILRHDLLGIEVDRRTERRGTFATIGLVAFFAVAQITQQFLSESMGVVLGGAAAGALLFAAVPLQRLAERATGRETLRSAPAVGSAKEDAYRAALRLALRDRELTKDEELGLALLSDELGLTSRRAREIRYEVEAEAQPVPRVKPSR